MRCRQAPLAVGEVRVDGVVQPLRLLPLPLPALQQDLLPYRRT